MGIKSKAISKKGKKARYASVNVIREFDKLPYKSYQGRITKHEPTGSYFYTAIHLAKCIVRSDALNLHVYSVRTETTGKKQIPTLYVCSTDKSELKEFLLDKKYIADLFYRRGRIKKHHRQQMFYGGR